MALGALVVAVFAYGVLVFVGIALYVDALANPPTMNAVYARNTGDAPWLVRLPDTEFGDPPRPLVVRISPGADGAVIHWPKDQVPRVEVLEVESCVLLGTLEIREGQSYTLGGAPGLTLLIRNGTGRNNLPEIEEVEVCDG